MSSHDPLTALMARVARGERAALPALFDALGPEIWDRAVACYGNTAEAEDATVDVFRALWEDAGFVRDGSGDLRSHARGILRNLGGDGAGLLSEAPSQAIPPQLLNRIETELFGGQRDPLWRQVLPYGLGAVAAALVAWAVSALGLLDGGSS